MPEMDGITLCKKIRQMIGSSYIYIILITGKSMSEDVVFGLDSGADDYLVKPYEKSILIARVNVGIRIVQLEREKERQLQEILNTNRKMRQNMKTAAQIQLSLLPPANINFGNFTFNWYFKPSDLLGGDMLHIYPLSEYKVACYVLDVSGHGTQAALLSVAIRNQLTTRVAERTNNNTTGSLISLNQSVDATPEIIINQLADHYSGLLDRSGQYFTILYGTLDLTTGIFDYVSAGHHNPILISVPNRRRYKRSGGLPIGLFNNQNHEARQIQLSPGEKLYIFTDGIIEERNKKGKQFGMERLRRSLRESVAESNSLPLLLDYFSQWTGKSSFQDDIALIEIQGREC
jgi:sigma-B regulation protein RsbU (phosphoserine phosphatase)